MSNDQFLLLHDTETTGASKQDEVIQWAGILYNLTKMEEVGHFNSYFWTGRAMDPAAVNTHGITKRVLMAKSKGRMFEVALSQELKFLKKIRATFVAFNENFDHRMINQTLTLNGYEPFDMGPLLTQQTSLSDIGKFRSRFCLMNFIYQKQGHKGGKLASFLPEYGLSLSKVRTDFEKNYPDSSGEGTHNALFDSYIMLKLVEEMVKLERSSRVV